MSLRVNKRLSRICSITALVLTSTTCYCQEQLTQVVNASGGNYEKGGVLLNWNVGELSLVNAMASIDSTLWITNGFLQPEGPSGGPVMTSVPAEFVMESQAARVRVFPNPVQDVLQIDYTDNYYGDMYVTIFDNAGKLVYAKTVYSSGNGFKQKINISQLTRGSYLLNISPVQKPQSKQVYTYKLIKS